MQHVVERKRYENVLLDNKKYFLTTNQPRTLYQPQ